MDEKTAVRIDNQPLNELTGDFNGLVFLGPACNHMRAELLVGSLLYRFSWLKMLSRLRRG